MILWQGPEPQSWRQGMQAPGSEALPCLRFFREPFLGSAARLRVSWDNSGRILTLWQCRCFKVRIGKSVFECGWALFWQWLWQAILSNSILWRECQIIHSEGHLRGSLYGQIDNFQTQRIKEIVWKVAKVSAGRTACICNDDHLISAVSAVPTSSRTLTSSEISDRWIGDLYLYKNPTLQMCSHAGPVANR